MQRKKPSHPLARTFRRILGSLQTPCRFFFLYCCALFCSDWDKDILVCRYDCLWWHLWDSYRLLFPNTLDPGIGSGEIWNLHMWQMKTCQFPSVFPVNQPIVPPSTSGWWFHRHLLCFNHHAWDDWLQWLYHMFQIGGSQLSSSHHVSVDFSCKVRLPTGWLHPMIGKSFLQEWQLTILLLH